MFKITAVAAGLLLAQGLAQAALVQSPSGFAAAQVVTFDSFDGLLSTGAVDVGTPDIGSAVTLRSLFDLEIGAHQRDLGANGLWGARGTPDSGLVDTPTGSGPFVATGLAPVGLLSFSLAQPVAGIGAWFNQYQDFDAAPGNFTLLAFDALGNTLESYTVGVDTAWDGYNEGSFFGIHRGAADIFGFAVTGSDVVLDNLTLTTAPIPEPGSYALMAAGLGLVGWLTRRRQQVR